MQVTKFPHNISKEIDNVNRNFFWNNNLERDGYQIPTSLISWNKICRAKYQGVLGIKKTRDINAALLTKLGWKILTDPDNI